MKYLPIWALCAFALLACQTPTAGDTPESDNQPSIDGAFANGPLTGLIDCDDPRFREVCTRGPSIRFPDFCDDPRFQEICEELRYEEVLREVAASRERIVLRIRNPVGDGAIFAAPLSNNRIFIFSQAKSAYPYPPEIELWLSANREYPLRNHFFWARYFAVLGADWSTVAPEDGSTLGPEYDDRRTDFSQDLFIASMSAESGYSSLQMSAHRFRQTAMSICFARGQPRFEEIAEDFRRRTTGSLSPDQLVSLFQVGFDDSAPVFDQCESDDDCGYNTDVMLSARGDRFLLRPTVTNDPGFLHAGRFFVSVDAAYPRRWRFPFLVYDLGPDGDPENPVCVDDDEGFLLAFNDGEVGGIGSGPTVPRPGSGDTVYYTDDMRLALLSADGEPIIDAVTGEPVRLREGPRFLASTETGAVFANSYLLAE
ncbi:MAG: hypothetical protein AAGD92_00745 [Pseudomonadota bacterium]